MKEKTINLPELWMTKKLGDLCDIARGGSPRPIQQYLGLAEKVIEKYRSLNQ
jgi:hypothetical protein